MEDKRLVEDETMNEALRKYFAQIGKRGGQSTSARKRAAARLNAKKPRQRKRLTTLSTLACCFLAMNAAILITC